VILLFLARSTSHPVAALSDCTNIPLAAGGAQEDETILNCGFSGHGFRRFVHLDPPRLAPGGIRELPWHPNTDEWQYYIEGRARMGVFASSGQARTFDYEAGDVGYVPYAMSHYIENTGDTPLRFLEMFKSSYYADLSLNQWLALLPSELVQAHMKFDPKVM
jgi:mannose-6-phosphate isomerase-like protein (cupin superfamily)